MRKIIFIIILLIFGVFFPSEIYGRLLPRFAQGGGGKRVAASGLVVGARLRGDRRALNVTFSNLPKVRNVTYTLMYQTNGKDEGVSGSLDSSSGGSVTRELLFGTCSAGICRYHQNITNMKLEVISELPSGKRTIKRFRIRV
jgi:hypothetical protein